MSERAGVAVKLGARRLTRRFGPVVANDRIDLAVAPGTIHAIVGGNGAGKSTLMRILQGVDHPDAGEIILDDASVRFSGPADAIRRGIGMVHQEFMLAPPLTLLENLILAREPMAAGGWIDRSAARAEAERLAKLAGVTIDWRQTAAEAPVHVRQSLEILRLLYRGADVLILDEPTAVLAPAQVRELIALMKRLKAEGRTILFISHKLDEVMSAADAISVMRAGRIVANVNPDDTSKAEIARWMVDENVEPVRIPPRARQVSRALLTARGLTAGTRGNVAALGPIDLEIREGEIVGVAGVAGNGQDELVASVAGLMEIDSGEIAFSGARMKPGAAGRFRDAGIGYLSADRAREGLCLTASLSENFIAGRESQPAFSRLGFLRSGAIRARARDVFSRHSVRYSRLEDFAGSLSGGNQQRIAIGRELDREPKLLIAAQPTRGVDIAGIAFIHARLAAFRDRGGAVLLITEELDELLTLSDRIIGLYGGAFVGELGREQATVEKVGRMMLGQEAA